MSKIPFNLNQRPSGFKLHCSQPSITFSAEGGAVLCTITTDTDDAKIYYLVNSFQSPNIEDNLYNGPFEVNLGDKVSAIVIKDGFLDSLVAVQTYIPLQELYIPPTIDGDTNPVLSEGMYNAYYVLKTNATSRSAKLMKGDVEVEGGATVAVALPTITEQTVEAVPELAAYIGWKYDIVTIDATDLEAGDYSIEYTADELSDDSLAFEVGSEPDYLCFTAEEESAKLSFIGGRTTDKSYDLPDIKYSNDKVNWTQLAFTEGGEDEGIIPFSSQVFTLGLGEKVYFKGINPNGFSLYNEDTYPEVYCIFSIEDGAIAASGDIGTITDEIGGADCVLTNGCYRRMFCDCTSLVTAPVLPATTLVEDCYDSMFIGCTSLVTAPALPATTLAKGCYRSMFIDCTSLVTAPVLPATTLADSCYDSMFLDCTLLNSVIVGATSWDVDAASDWLYRVAVTGTFTKPSATEIPEGTSGIPSGWAVVNV